jgi:hypothetical protein
VDNVQKVCHYKVFKIQTTLNLRMVEATSVVQWLALDPWFMGSDPAKVMDF